MFTFIALIFGAIAAAVVYVLWLFIGAMVAILATLIGMAVALGNGLSMILGWSPLAGWILSFLIAALLIRGTSKSVEVIWAKKH